jgi:hypothetical protein
MMNTFSALDAKSERLVQETINNVIQNKTVKLYMWLKYNKSNKFIKLIFK